MRQSSRSPALGIGRSVAHSQRLLGEHRQHLLLDRPVAHGLTGQMSEIDRALRDAGDRSPPGSIEGDRSQRIGHRATLLTFVTVSMPKLGHAVDNGLMGDRGRAAESRKKLEG